MPLTQATLTFQPGEVGPKAINVTVIGDSIDEDDEQFFVDLLTPSNATLTKASAVGTILDDDAPPVANINNISLTEEDDNTKTTVFGNFTVRLSAASARPVTVSYDVVAAATTPAAATTILRPVH